MTILSVLDLAPITEGSDAAASFRNSLELARHAEALGYHRYWLAEHHGMPGIASAATAVLIGHIAGGTSTMRVGAGGIMLPNHSPLVIAEQFGTLESLYPGRIDLGLGRAPGSDQVTARALRRNLDTDPDAFPRDVVELMEYFSENSRLPVTAVPGKGLSPQFWILGSSLFGAQLAAALGLPYAFASHFAPAALDEACARYRAEFEPSEQLAEPYLVTAMNVIADDDAARAVRQQEEVLRARVALVLPPGTRVTEEQADEILASPHGDRLRQMMTHTAVGTGAQAAEQVTAFAERTGADEVIVSHPGLRAEDRLRSVRLLGEHLG